MSTGIRWVTNEYKNFDVFIGGKLLLIYYDFLDFRTESMMQLIKIKNIIENRN